jgi:hypothetical protein
LERLGFRLFQCAARATRRVSVRGAGLARPCDVQKPDGASAEKKGYAKLTNQPKRARVNSAAHLPRSRQRELFLDRVRLPHLAMMAVGRNPPHGHWSIERTIDRSARNDWRLRQRRSDGEAAPLVLTT